MQRFCYRCSQHGYPSLHPKMLPEEPHNREDQPDDPDGLHPEGAMEVGFHGHKVGVHRGAEFGEIGSCDQPTDLQITTLWGAKGVTAEHVYLLGICGEAIPGERREEYPGTDADYFNEQRRLFYISITRPKRTLVLSRALKVKRGPARQTGLKLTSGGPYWANLTMSPFLEDILAVLPDAVAGKSWNGCVAE